MNLLSRQQRERQKSNMFNEQNNNSARALRFFVHFFAVPTPLRRENDQILGIVGKGNGKAINSTICV